MQMYNVIRLKFDIVIVNLLPSCSVVLSPLCFFKQVKSVEPRSNTHVQQNNQKGTFVSGTCI